MQPETDKPKNQPPKKRISPLTIATDIVSGICVGFAGGFYLDKWLNTKPLFIIIGLVLGMVAAFKMILREIK